MARSARSALFPKNTPAPARRIPEPGEQLLIRRSCAEAIQGEDICFLRKSIPFRSENTFSAVFFKPQAYATDTSK